MQIFFSSLYRGQIGISLIVIYVETAIKWCRDMPVSRMIARIAQSCSSKRIIELRVTPRKTSILLSSLYRGQITGISLILIYSKAVETAIKWCRDTVLFIQIVSHASRTPLSIAKFACWGHASPGPLSNLQVVTEAPQTA
jgi:hypothetical protein